MPFTIVGVTPPGFFGVAVGVPVDVTIPLTILPRLRADEREALTSVGNSWLNIMGRLRPGTSVAAADAEFQTLWPQILSTTADGVSPGRRQRYLTFTSGLDSAASGYSPVRRQFRDALWLLFGLVCLLLVAACATVANLLLAASAGRRHELALRVALGAARRRIAQQLFVEGLMLAAGGAALGLLFSAWAGDLLIGLLSTSYDTVAVSVVPDWRVFTFIALTVGLATTVFTMAPIASAARIEPARMHEAGPRQTGSLYRARLAPALVAVQVAISLTLLAGSALFVRNLSQLLATDIGFVRENLWVVGLDAMSPVSAPQGRAPEVKEVKEAKDLTAYYGELLRRLRETPGVQSASLSFKAPISNEQGSWWSTFATDGSTGNVDPAHRTYLNAISPEYFSTIGMPLLAGRDFTSGDREGAPPVVIINASLARELFGNESPIGRYVLRGEDATRLEVVGVVRDVTYQNLVEERRRIAYLPYLQENSFLRARNLVAVVRIAGPSATIAETLRTVVRNMDPTVPLTIQNVESRIGESLVQERLLTIIALFLGAVSLVLACGALAGLMSHLVTARTREFGLRLALGAERRSVVGLVMRQALTVAVAGGIAGLGFSLAGGRLVSSFLTTIGPSDPPALAAAAAILLGTTAVAAYVPARRASRVEPMVALRAD